MCIYAAILICISWGISPASFPEIYWQQSAFGTASDQGIGAHESAFSLGLNIMSLSNDYRKNKYLQWYFYIYLNLFNNYINLSKCGISAVGPKFISFILMCRSQEAPALPLSSLSLFLSLSLCGHYRAHFATLTEPDQSNHGFFFPLRCQGEQTESPSRVV